LVDSINALRKLAVVCMSISCEEALAEAENLIRHLHSEGEIERTRLARDLHDELGGLMVSAVMDLSYVRGRMPGLDAEFEAHLERIKESIEAGIDIGRRLTEDLRPSILDNFGLFPAIQWHSQRARRGSQAVWTETYPAIEPILAPNASTALFRVAQGALGLMFKREAITYADLTIRVEEGAISMTLSDDGIPTLQNGGEAGTAIALASMSHRIRAHGGQVVTGRTLTGGTTLTARMPLAKQPDPEFLD
jgi:signal transduction histidine kinase